MSDREKQEADYIYEVWRSGGDPDAVDRHDIPKDFDWVWDKPLREHLPQREASYE